MKAEFKRGLVSLVSYFSTVSTPYVCIKYEVILFEKTLLTSNYVDTKLLAYSVFTSTDLATKLKLGILWESKTCRSEPDSEPRLTSQTSKTWSLSLTTPEPIIFHVSGRDLKQFNVLVTDKFFLSSNPLSRAPSTRINSFPWSGD